MTAFFKKSVLQLDGYASPPQKEFRVKLNQNESPFDVPQEFKDELTKALNNTPWNRYPINESPDLMKKLADRHGVHPRQVLLGNGSNQLFQTLLTAIIAPGDKVLYTPPTFSLYELYSTIYNAERIEIEQAPHDDYPLQKILQVVETQKPKILFLCSPNNPTGYEIDLAAVAQICEATNGLVFFDEAYAEFTGQSAISLLEKYDNLLISRTFSKAFSMAGLRFGYFIGSEKVVHQLRKVNLPYNVNIFTEMAALYMLDHVQVMQKNIDAIKRERNRVFARLNDLNSLVVYPSAANFLLIKGPPGLDLFQVLKEQGVLVRDVSSYPLLQGHQRVTIGLKEDNDILLHTLQTILDDTK